MTSDDLTPLIPLLLSAGGGAFVLSVLQGWRETRAGVRQGQRETVEDLIRWRDDLDRQLRDATDDRDYWRDLCARRGHQLRNAGIEPADPNPTPPTRRRVDLEHGGRNP